MYNSQTNILRYDDNDGLREVTGYVVLSGTTQVKSFGSWLRWHVPRWC